MIGRPCACAFRHQLGATLHVRLAGTVEVADVHVRAGRTRVADQADVGLGGAFRVDTRHVGDVGEGRHGMRGRKLAHRGQFLHAGAGGIGVEDADANAALVQALRQAIENSRHLGLGGHILHPATVPHGTAERFQRGFFIGAGHGTDAREGPVGGGTIVQHTSLGLLTPVPGCDRQHPRF